MIGVTLSSQDKTTDIVDVERIPLSIRVMLKKVQDAKEKNKIRALKQ